MNACLKLAIACIVGAVVAHLCGSPGMVGYCSVMGAALTVGSIVAGAVDENGE